MRKQQGMTFVGMLFTAAAIIIAAVIVMRIIPVYLQYYNVVESVKGLNSIPASSFTGDSYTDIATLRSSLYKRLDINGVENIKGNEIIIVPNGVNKFSVTVKYQVIKPLIYNISLLFNFNYTNEVVTGSES